MKKISLSIIAVLLFASLSAPSLAAAPAKGDVAAGEKLANEGDGTSAPCTSCHGPTGAGIPESNFPRIAGFSAYYLGKQLRDFRSGQRKQAIMQPLASGLSDQQIADLAAYYASLPPPPLPEAPAADAALLAAGEQLAEGGDAKRQIVACANCHGPMGIGLPPAIPALVGQSSGYIAAQLKAWQSGDRSNDDGGLMAAVAKELGDDDIAAVAAYYSTVRPDRPEP